jgi:hypothetical protein
MGYAMHSIRAAWKPANLGTLSQKEVLMQTLVVVAALSNNDRQHK